MHLKCLEIIGFKSFANKTTLDFGSGMTCIVGPNGCGKSNVSDAVRWVLGEQSAKALRGSKMEDVIFNGTDVHKPLNMAEVSLTFTDAEDRLGTDYNEVTVTRRVYRSGEGQYFINRKPSRLKDIQRLFMDSGVGRNSYSIMEQGKIDQILSSRPEDRRAVFEEASGITKFKADKREAMRKLGQTDANLMRLEDIVREVKRQIISLQRQAGKARRYQALKEKLQGVELYLTRRRLRSMDEEGERRDQRLGGLIEEADKLRAEMEGIESATASSRAALAETEQEIAGAMERAMQAKSRLDNTRRAIDTNRERIEELENYATRDSQDAEQAEARLVEHRGNFAALVAQVEALRGEVAESKSTYEAARLKAEETDLTLNAARNAIRELREQSQKAEGSLGDHQRELADLAEREKDTIVKRERLRVDAEELAAMHGNLGRQLAEMETKSKELAEASAGREAHLEELRAVRQQTLDRRRELEERSGQLERDAAAKRAALELLTKQEAQHQQFPGGARMLLEHDDVPEIESGTVLGPLAELIKAKPGYEAALESVLRPYLDAVVIHDTQSMRRLLGTLEHVDQGSARMLSATPGITPAEVDGSLLEMVETADSVRELAACLLGPVRVVEDRSDLPEEGLAVTRGGVLVRGREVAEYFGSDDQVSNPLHIRHLKEQNQEDLARIEDELGDLRRLRDSIAAENQDAEAQVAEARKALEDERQAEARFRGEVNGVRNQLEQVGRRRESVGKELERMESEQSPGEERRRDVVARIEKLEAQRGKLRADLTEQEELFQKIEITRGHLAADASEKRVVYAEANQRLESLVLQQVPSEQRIREIESLITNRNQGVESYRNRVEKLAEEIRGAEASLEPLEEDVRASGTALEEARARRQKQSDELQVADRRLREMRSRAEALQRDRSALDIKAAEAGVRRQSLLDRIEEEYGLVEEEIARVPDPEWEGDEIPGDDAVAEQVAELKRRMEKMGPVNLVAIEEHAELEDRYVFLEKQQTDLVEAKKQLEDTIKRIDRDTMDRFMDTFHRVNENFQAMFKRLFGGGKAELSLMDEDNALESGVEIIARPPGKKPQVISLLSGGERTMTAVALLFSLYQVKPSPFCFLDELDAALDDANIGRFVDMVQSFIEDSQFIVITHNRQTINAAGVLYGVTMQEKGVSKIVSVKLSDYDEAGV